MIPTLPLDPVSLVVASSLTVAFSGVLLLCARRSGRQNDVAVIWGASLVTGALGFAILLSRTLAPLWASDIATTFFLVAVSISWVGARVFSGRRARADFAVVGPAAWLVSLPLQHLLPAWLAPAWVALACLLGAAYTVAIAAELTVGRAESLPSRPLALALLLAHAGFYVIRAVIALFVPDIPLWGTSIVNILLLEGLLHAVGMAFLMLAMLKERTELRSNEQFRRLSLQDGLTGIANRRHFDERLGLETRRAARRGAPVALLMIDVDYFKAFNDSLGHQRGDDCLKAIAKRLALGTRRPGDLLARYGGEEFVRLLPDTDIDGALIVAEQARASIEALSISAPSANGPARTVSVSVGAASLVPQTADKSALQLIRMADKALYEAKAAGRNAVRAYAADRTD